MGSIADRMKALSGKGMDVGSSAKRISKDLSPAAHLPLLPNKAVTGASSITGGAGTYGPCRMVGNGQNGDTNTTRDSVSTIEEHSTSTAAKKPSIHPKPQHVTSPTSPIIPSEPPQEDTVPVQQTVTGSSSRSRRSTGRSEPGSGGISPYPTSNWPITSPPVQSHPTLSPIPSGSTSEPQAPSQPSNSRFPLPTLPTIPHSPAARQVSSATSSTSPSPTKSPLAPVKSVSADNLDEFEKAFPSLSEFGKQFDTDTAPGPPNGFYPFERDPDSSNSVSVSGLPGVKPTHSGDERQTIYDDNLARPEISLPEVDGLPDLPSAPTTRLPAPSARHGLPPPPARPGDLRMSEEPGLGPPSPDMGAGIKRPASTPNAATLPGTYVPGSSPELRDPTLATIYPRPPLPAIPGRSPNGQTSDRSSHGGPSRSPPPVFPVAQPLLPPPSSTTKEATTTKALATKPNFPLANSVDCDTLRSYILNPAVDLLMLDVRSEEEFERGHVGQEYEARGAKVRVVWLDPTVIMRDG